MFVACGTAVLLSACSAQTPASESPEQPTETAAGGAESEQSADSVGESGPSSETSDASAQAEAAGPTSTEGADSSASTPRCTVDDLETTVDQGDSSAGHLNFTITFANTSEQTCKLDGHPGVSAVGDDDGTQIGDSATREGKARKAVVLIPHAHATADIQAANIGDDGGPLGDSCDATAADGWRIYPPGSKASVYVEQDGLRACAAKNADWLSVSVVEPVS